MDNFKVSNQSNRSDRNVISVRDAIIEEIFRDRNVGYVTISYGIMGEFNMIHINLVTLLVGQDTIIQNHSGRDMLLRDLEKGMTVDAEFSNMMTSSVPPQSRAFKITVLSGRRASNITVDRVLRVDTANNFLTTGNAADISSQIRFVINDSTLILDRRGNRICLCNLRTGQMVRVEHASNMTFSIPPQTTAYSVQIV